MQRFHREVGIHHPATNDAVASRAEQLSRELRPDAATDIADNLPCLNPTLYVAALCPVHFGDIAAVFRGRIDAGKAQYAHRTHRIRRLGNEAEKCVHHALESRSSNRFADLCLHTLYPAGGDAVMHLREQTRLGTEAMRHQAARIAGSFADRRECRALYPALDQKGNGRLGHQLIRTRCSLLLRPTHVHSRDHILNGLRGLIEWASCAQKNTLPSQARVRQSSACRGRLPTITVESGVADV